MRGRWGGGLKEGKKVNDERSFCGLVGCWCILTADFKIFFDADSC